MHHWEPEEVGGWWVRVEEADPVELDPDEETDPAEAAGFVEDVLEAVELAAWGEEEVIEMGVLEAAWTLVAARYSAGWITISGVKSMF